MAQCPKCGCNHSGSGLCGNCRRKEEQANWDKERQKDNDRKRRREIEKVQKTNPTLAAQMRRELDADTARSKAAGGGGSYFVPIVAAVIIIGVIIFAVIFFGKGVYMNFAAESGAMSVIRDEKSGTFLKKGEAIPNEEISANKTALEDFAQSGASYRMEGEFHYGLYKSGHKAELVTDVEMSYNADTDIYRFALSSRLGDAELDKIVSIEDGTYLVVKENGKTYVLSEIEGIKTALEIIENRTVYNFLMSYSMENVMYTGVIDRSDSDRLSLWNADYYRCLYDDNGYMIVSNPKTELRTYNDKPVYYLHKIKNKENSIEYLYILNFYYDDIPHEKPDITEYQ
jgi:hypothetical protein